MKKLYCYIFVFLAVSCNYKGTKNNQNAIKTINLKDDTVTNYCGLIKELMYYYENSNSNLKLNELIPIIEEKTNTQSNADKGYIGYWYKSDTIFYNDINQWKKILGCK